MFLLSRKLHMLNWHVIANIIGYVLVAEGLLLLLPCICDLIYQEHIWIYYMETIIPAIIVGLILSRMKVPYKSYFAKDGMVAVGLSWIVASAVGAMPFWLSGEIPHYVDAFFEAVSGFTTTGSSILTDVEAMSHANIFWRSFTHWIGGMGILVFILALLPKSNDRNMHVMRAESPGPVIGKLVPRLKQSALILYEMYFGLTVLMIIILAILGMPFFDNLCNTFGTAGTGGFAILNESIGQYNNVGYEITITVFMLLFGVNFNVYYCLVIRDFKSAFNNEEVRTYFLIVFISMVLIALNIWGMYGSLATAFRHSSFQVASIITTTGYSSTDFNYWPMFSKVILMFLMLLGACAGSTGGGLKVSRFLVILKKIRLDVQRLMHPQKVEVITMDGKVLDETVVNQIMAFFCCFILIFVGCLLIVSLDNFNFITTFSATLTCIGNVGPGLGLAGPLGNFHMFSDLSKLVLSFAMLVGRLEIYPILIFTLPIFNITKIKKHKR